MKKIKIGFTGTRDEITEFQKNNLKDTLQNIKDPIESVHHGDCVGADTAFHEICAELGLKIVIHPPEKQDLRAFNKGDVMIEEKSYFARNRDIVDECDLLIACTKTNFETKGGTWYTINYAIKRKKFVIKIFPERVEYDISYLKD